MTTLSRATSAKLSNMAFVCTCLIVLHHVPKAVESADLYGVLVRLGSISNIAVPFFFLASGFLLVGQCDQPGWWKRALARRFHTLLIPYLMVNLIYFPLMWLYHNLPGPAFHAGMTYELSFRNFLAAFGLVFPQNPACGPLWYVRMLFLLILVSPAFVFSLRRSRGLAVSFMTIVAGLYFLGLLPVKDEIFGARGLFFFTLGIGLRIYGTPRESRLVGVLSALVCLVCTWYAGDVALSAYIRARLGCGLALFGVLALWNLTPVRPWPKVLTSSCFAVYCFHMLVIFALRAVAGATHTTSWLLTIPGLVLCVSVPVIACCLLHEFASSRFPKAARLLFGGR